MLEDALHLAVSGMRVFPCQPGRKNPLIENWPNLATTDRATIERWWAKWPNANIAIACGGHARLLVVDIDPGGEQSLTDLEATHGKLPETIGVITPRGGKHQYFQVSSSHKLPGNSAGKLGPKIDTRANGGYVLAPPSRVVDAETGINGSYIWNVKSGRVAFAPEWLISLLATKHTSTKTAARCIGPDRWEQFAKSTHPEGERNVRLTELCGYLVRLLGDGPSLARELLFL